MDETILRRLREVVAECFRCDPAAVGPDTTALDVDGWDSVSHVYFLHAVERAFAITLPMERAYELANLGELALLVAARKTSP